MPGNELGSALAVLIAHLSDGKPEVAQSIAVIAQQIADAARGIVNATPATTSNSVPASAPQTSNGAAASQLVTPTAPVAPIPTPVTVAPVRPVVPLPTALVPLKLGDQSLHVKVHGTSTDIAAARSASPPPVWTPVTESTADLTPPDLELIAERCELKARSCRVMIERRAASGTPREQELIREINALVAQGKQKHKCFLWAVFPGREQPDDGHLRDCAEAYANLGIAATLAHAALPDRPGSHRRDALALLATAQSALRAALQHTWLTAPDQDQDDAFRYLSQATSYEGIFIERHMRLTDPADPAEWESLRHRLEEFRGRLADEDAAKKKVRTALSTIKHHVRVIQSDLQADHSRDWAKIEDAVGVLAAAKSLGEARDLLRPLADRMPESAALARRAVIRRDEPEDVAGERDEAAFSERVQRVGNWLRGRRAVLVGGEEYPHQAERIKDAFGLDDLAWVSLREHASSAPLEHEIADPRTAVVIVLVRLAGHGHVHDAREFARAHDVPAVLLKAGYNPEQIAAAVLEQASDRLAAG